MTKSARQARKKSMDEEALQARESQCNGKLLAPLDLSGPDSGDRHTHTHIYIYIYIYIYVCV